MVATQPHKYTTLAAEIFWLGLFPAIRNSLIWLGGCIRFPNQVETASAVAGIGIPGLMRRQTTSGPSSVDAGKLKMKLTTVEKRAKALCESFLQFGGGSIGIEWKRSSMYGYNPVIEYHGGKACNISGCGYDKLSAALAAVLCFLFPVGSEQYNRVVSLGGCGESTVRDTLASLGWKLEHTATGKTFDAYTLSKGE